MVTGESEIKGMTERVRKIKEELQNTKPIVSTERLKFLLDAYKETEGEPPIIKRAVLLDKQLREKSIFIDDNPVVGNLTKYPLGVEFFPEWSVDGMVLGQKFATSRGDTELPMDLSEQEKKLIKEALDYWKDICTIAKTKKIWSQKYPDEDINSLRNHIVWWDCANRTPHRTVGDFEKVIRKGMKGIISQAEERLKKVPSDKVEGYKQMQFLNSVITVLKAVMALAERYSALAQEMASKEKNPERKEELEEIARICKHVPANPARNFREALQSFWFAYLVEEIAHTAQGFSPGRLGYYTYPFYKKDKEEGKITEEEAIELLEFLFLRISSNIDFAPVSIFRGLQGNLFQNISIGGMNPDGSDATNEVDFLIIEAQRRVKVMQPTITLLYHDKISDELMLKAVGLVRTGIGMPAFVNHEIGIQRLLDLGVSLAESRTSCIAGCLESGIAGAMAIQSGPFQNMPKMLELALNNGVDPVRKKQIGPKTGDSKKFTSYDQLYEAYRKQNEYFTLRATDFENIRRNVDAECLSDPYLSAIMEDCIEKAKDVHNGGARYHLNGNIMTGMINVADSLAAIKKLVFEEKSVTMDELLKALQADFVGYEELHKHLLDAPKYGNNDDYVDSIAKGLYDNWYREHQKYTDNLGQKRTPPALSVTAHFGAGMNTGALPCGRKAGVPLVDASCSPEPGLDKNGPTALLLSAAKIIDHVRFNATQLNMKFHPTTLKDRTSQKKLISLIRTYMGLGGYHVQFNVVGAETLRAAQIRPQEYRDLIVRVAGFSAYYIHLDKGVQDEIIKRTELAL